MPEVKQVVKVDLKEILFRKREENRKKWETILNEHTGDRKHIEKKELENLLFEEVMIKFSNDEENGHLAGRKIRAKIIVWSGSFLSKVNLEEINFDNVIWDVMDFLKNDRVSYFKIEEESIEEVKRVTKGKDKINLSNTNPTIDFSKSFWSILGSEPQIEGCNFANVDLSNNILNQVCIWDSNFQNTGIKICNNQFYSEDQMIAIFGSNMEGTDLSECTVYGRYVDAASNLKDTGLRIITSPEMQEDEKIALGKLIKNGQLDGCYLNGTYIERRETLRARAKDIAEFVKNPNSTEFKEMLSKIDISKHTDVAEKIIEILNAALDSYKKLEVIEIKSIVLKYKRVNNALKEKDRDALNRIIIQLADELEKGYEAYLKARENLEISETDDNSTLEIGIKILKTKEMLQAIIEAENKNNASEHGERRLGTI